MLIALFVANLRMIIRNRQALFWALVFPLIFVTIFGLFRLDQAPTINLLVVDHAKEPMSTALVQNLSQIPTFKVQERDDETKARADVKNGNAGYLLIIPGNLAAQVSSAAGGQPASIVLLYDSSTETSAIILGVIQKFIDDTNAGLTHAPRLIQLQPEGVQAKKLNYFDFVLLGIVGMGVMTYSIIGLSATMALYREQKILKRMLATPLKVSTFFASQIMAFLLLSVVQALIILAVGVLFFHGHVYGNILYVLLLIVIANVVFLNLGFVVGALTNSVRAADGMANAVTMPMMFLSGTFFPKENLPVVLGKAVQFLPLSPLLDAMRGVALDAKPFWDYPTELAILGGWIVLSSILAVRVFRFS